MNWINNYARGFDPINGGLIFGTLEDYKPLKLSDSKIGDVRIKTFFDLIFYENQQTNSKVEMRVEDYDCHCPCVCRWDFLCG